MDQTFASNTQSRVIRVFVSSTFKDMQAERDELVKRIFPQLRKLCEQRGLTWAEVDLRWGITDEQSSEGQVLPICLTEIQNCRPYFIGLLGERYGWIPETIPQELVDREPWLGEHRDHSVTELEILHGVLNNPKMAEHAYFYFRDPAYIASLPAGEQAEFREGPTQKEVSESGSEEAEQRAEARQQKLTTLKERIRSSNFPVKENYLNPEVLGALVLHDLTELIDRLFPENEQPNLLDREAAGHEAFAVSRAKVYIGRQEYFDTLDAHASGDGAPLVVLGESGSGKSALLANWAQRYRKTHPDDLLIMHFIGATPSSVDWVSMLQRIMGEFKRRFDITGEIPDKPDALMTAFDNWLSMAGAKGRIVLILDALNQLEDRYGAPELVWLPRVIPEKVRFILSTLTGRPLDAIKKRGWPTMQVKPLVEEERKQLIADYLAQYKKTLSPQRTTRIASASQTANPLFLRALLEELRVFGVHELLDERISYYLEVVTVTDLYGKILDRYEKDYENKKPGLVREAMSLIFSARNGLSESELLDLLGTDGNPLPRAYWSPLYLAAEQALISRSGLIGFADDFLRQSVQDRYLSTEGDQVTCHLRIADYFEPRPIGGRKVNELSWQLAQAKAWTRLYHLLSESDFITAAWDTNQFEVEAHWAQVEQNSTATVIKAYQTVLDNPINYVADIRVISSLFVSMGHPKQAIGLRKFLVDYYEKNGNKKMLLAALIDFASVILEYDNLDEGITLLNKAEAMLDEMGHDGLGSVNVAQSYLDNLRAIQNSKGNILFIRGDLDEAMNFYTSNEGICRKLGDWDGVLVALCGKTNILFTRGDLDAAMGYHKEEEYICRLLRNRTGLSRSLGNQAVILSTRGDLDGAMRLHQEEEQLCRELGNKDGLSNSLANQALILKTRGDLDRAMVLNDEAEHICRVLGNKNRLSQILYNQARCLTDRGNGDEAMKLFEEQALICRELGKKDELTISLDNQADILLTRGDLDGVMVVFGEEESLCRELGNHERLAKTLVGQAVGLNHKGNKAEALRLANEAYRLAEGNGLPEEAKKIDGIRAHFRSAQIGENVRKNPNESEKTGDRANMQDSLDQKALILKKRGDLDGAMAIYKEEERACRDLENFEGLARSLIEQATILGLKKNKPKEALPLVDEAYRLAVKNGYATFAKQIFGIRADIRKRIK